MLNCHDVVTMSIGLILKSATFKTLFLSLTHSANQSPPPSLIEFYDIADSMLVNVKVSQTFDVIPKHTLLT